LDACELPLQIKRRALMGVPPWSRRGQCLRLGEVGAKLKFSWTNPHESLKSTNVIFRWIPGFKLEKGLGRVHRARYFSGTNPKYINFTLRSFFI
jgi:hypothetical protein